MMSRTDCGPRGRIQPVDKKGQQRGGNRGDEQTDIARQPQDITVEIANNEARPNRKATASSGANQTDDSRSAYLVAPAKAGAQGLQSSNLDARFRALLSGILWRNSVIGRQGKFADWAGARSVVWVAGLRADTG